MAPTDMFGMPGRSMAGLSRLPADTIPDGFKVDQSFTQGFSGDSACHLFMMPQNNFAVCCVS